MSAPGAVTYTLTPPGSACSAATDACTTCTRVSVAATSASGVTTTSGANACSPTPSTRPIATTLTVSFAASERSTGATTWATASPGNTASTETLYVAAGTDSTEVASPYASPCTAANAAPFTFRFTAGASDDA